MKQITALIEEYVKLFDGYPYYYMSGLDKDKQRQLLEKAINDRTPIEPNYEEDALY